MWLWMITFLDLQPPFCEQHKSISGQYRLEKLHCRMFKPNPVTVLHHFLALAAALYLLVL
jgi:hypothetical protein